MATTLWNYVMWTGADGVERVGVAAYDDGSAEDRVADLKADFPEARIVQAPPGKPPVPAGA